MFKLATMVFVAGLAAGPVIAEPISQPLDFARDGVRYAGTIVTYDDGSRRIAGHEVESGRDFALFVAKGRVTGRYDGQDVSYPAPAARGIARLAGPAGL